jgi:hypothetical protein
MKNARTYGNLIVAKLDRAKEKKQMDCFDGPLYGITESNYSPLRLEV